MTITSADPLQVGEAVDARPSRRLRIALLLIAVTQLTLVLDATIVTVALPHIQESLHFSNASLQWIVTAYTLVSGGMLLLGGRLGDLLGRRNTLIGGMILFTTASLMGGLAQSEAWLIVCRVAQGIGAAVMAPATLALIYDNFPDGQLRNRAMSVWAAMSALGGAVGLLAGGLLTTYASWRWTLFVNIPIGVAVVALAPLVLAPSTGRRERLDLLGSVTVTLGIAALIYGLSSAAPTGAFDHAHWGTAKVIVSLIAGAVLVGAFLVTEATVSQPLLPLRLLAHRGRAGSYLVAACIGVAFFGVLYFLTLFLQEVWGYSPAKAGLAFLPWVVTFAGSATISGRLLPRLGARTLLISGATIAAAGLGWLAFVHADSSYATHVLGPIIVAPFGVGLMAVPLASLAMTDVDPAEAGVAASLLSVGQQIGASLGIAGLGTVAWTIVAHRLAGQQNPTSDVYRGALAAGFDRGFLITAGAMVLALLCAFVVKSPSAAPTEDTAAA